MSVIIHLCTTQHELSLFTNVFLISNNCPIVLLKDGAQSLFFDVMDVILKYNNKNKLIQPYIYMR